jgi:hypothetical protein
MKSEKYLENWFCLLFIRMQMFWFDHRHSEPTGEESGLCVEGVAIHGRLGERTRPLLHGKDSSGVPSE